MTCWWPSKSSGVQTICWQLCCCCCNVYWQETSQYEKLICAQVKLVLVSEMRKPELNYLRLRLWQKNVTLLCTITLLVKLDLVRITALLSLSWSNKHSVDQFNVFFVQLTRRSFISLPYFSMQSDLCDNFYVESWNACNNMVMCFWLFLLQSLLYYITNVLKIL